MGEVATLQAVANQCAAAIAHARAREAVLMKARGMTEEEAHREIQKRSMDHRRSIREVAEAILLVEGGAS